MRLTDDDEAWKKFQSSYIGETQGEIHKLRRDSHYTELAQVLQIIFLGDLEVSESLMEMIFAWMMEKLEDTAKEAKDKFSDEGRAKEANELCTRLRKDVAQGWFFFKKFWPRIYCA